MVLTRIVRWKDGELLGTYEGSRTESDIIEWATGLSNGDAVDASHDEL